ncbi:MULTISPECIES: hypothetical protein [unclassified Microcystis]|uniref:hypothetical protein n=1 Tax=unclassified Microcystis TaxID=2643300 RepID=UPI003CD0D5C4
MNEQRGQAYVNLIEQLLTCADGEELNNILQANQELIDPEFLQVMENYATWLEEQGNNDHADLVTEYGATIGAVSQFSSGNYRGISGVFIRSLTSRI